LIDYTNNGDNNNTILLVVIERKNLKSIPLPNIQEVYLKIECQLFLSEFTRNNGEDFKCLELYGETSVGVSWQNLKLLSIPYHENNNYLKHLIIVKI